MTVVSTPGALMSAEIDEQPDVLRRLLAEGTGPIAEVSAAIAAADPRFVLLAARGTSDHAALYAKYLLEVGRGLPVGLASPSSLTVYSSRPDLRDVLFVTVSQSGGSPDLVDSTAVARDCGALTVAVTNNPGSALASTAQLHVDVGAGVERAVAATKTYTAELLALYLLLGPSGPSALGDRAARVPDAAAETLAMTDVGPVVARLREVQTMITTGRGYSYATARESALKLMETSYLNAQAFSAADLLHGPMAMIEAGSPVLAVASAGRGGQAMAPVLDRLSEVGADVIRVGGPAGPDRHLPIADDSTPEELVPILEILPLQRLALELAVARGQDPDRPRGLTKVTETW